MSTGSRVTVLSPGGLAGSYAAVLLDLDGTLVDSEQAVDRAWRDWCRRHGVDYAELDGLLHGRTAVDLIGVVRPSWSAERVAEAARYQLEFQERDPSPGTALPGARELLAGLGSRHRWAVVTACTSRLARHRLASAGLPQPPLLVSCDDVSRGKPSP
jgi:mannitol-1-/sugar-/sorbitol-6-phosphatase